MVASLSPFGRLSASDMVTLFSVTPTSQTVSASAVGLSVPDSPMSVGHSDAASAIQAILAKAQVENAPLATLGGGTSWTKAQPDAAPPATSSAASPASASASSTAEASLASPLSKTTQDMFDAVTAIGGDSVVAKAGINFATLALTTTTQTGSGVKSETASVADGNWDHYTENHLQSGNADVSQGGAYWSNQNRSWSAASTDTQNAQPALRLAITANDMNAFDLGEAQAKALATAYTAYLSNSGSTAGAGFSFSETYGQPGTIQGTILVTGELTSVQGPMGPDNTIQRQTTAEGGGYEAFTVPLSALSKPDAQQEPAASNG